MLHRLVRFTLVLSSASALAQPAAEAPPPTESPPATPEPSAPESATPPPVPPAPVTPAPATPALGPTPAPVAPSAPKPATLTTKPGGYLQADSRLFLDDSGTHELTVRRLRFKVDGTAYRYVNFRTLVDVAGSKLVVDDAWAELALRPELALRFGKDKAQFGIERLKSATQLTFIERSYPTQIVPNRDLGLAARGDVCRGVVHYSLAVVDGVADNAVIEGETDSELEYNAHVLISPFKASSLQKSFELAIGGAATFGRTTGTLTNTGLTAIKSAGQSTLVKFAGAATSDLDHTAHTDGYRHREAVHAYFYGGPVGALVEYVRDNEPIVLVGKHTLVTNTAWQIAASIAVTPGDRPSYKSLKPTRVFDPAKGTWGALELAARYAELRIDHDAFTAGIADDDASVRRVRALTFGVNWYLSEAVKLQLDYERSSFTAGAPDANRPTENLIATRFQVAI